MDSGWQPGMTLEACEKMIILKALRVYGGNKAQTAVALGVAEKTIYNKLEKYEADQAAEERSFNERRDKNAELQARAKGSFQTSADGSLMQTGLSVEPAPRAPAQLDLPVRERSEVQSLPSGKAPAGSARKAR